jgi:Domain of unknown function (DUF4395)
MSSDITQVDVRGPRFAAWITTAVLIITLIASAFSAPVAAVILGAQAVVFAIGAFRGPRSSPYGALFAKLVKEREPVPPLKFAQVVGLVFAVIGVVAFAAAVPLVGAIATAFALFAAFLNAAFGICLGCQLYPFVARLRRAPVA